MMWKGGPEPPAPEQRVEVLGLPEDLPVDAAAVFRSRVSRSARELFDETGADELRLVVRRAGLPPGPPPPAPPEAAVPGLDERVSYFTPVEPLYDLDRVVLPRDVLEELHIAIDTVRLRDLVFGAWGLHEIEPRPRSAIGLSGPPGTGKTMAAHGLARLLGRKILLSRTSQLESKYHGEGGKYLAALFEAARRANAVIFIDEAESLLSRRFESVGQGAEHAINTLRSELIQHLDSFEGVAVFATNLVEAYDPAISSRLHHVRFPLPDFAARRAIWAAHLPPALPLAADVSAERLAETEGVVGRDIKKVVINAAVLVARRGGDEITQADLTTALNRLLAQRPGNAGRGRIDGTERQEVEEEIRKRTD